MQITEVTATELSSLNPLPALSFTSNHNSLQAPIIMAAICPRQSKGIMCRTLVSSEDHSLALLQHNKLVWVREEALSTIVTTEIVELPMSDRDQAIETEFDQKESELKYFFIIFINKIKNIKFSFSSFLN